jgi:hypothetical protein
MNRVFSTAPAIVLPQLPERPQAVGIGSIFGTVEAYFYVAHGCQVVDLIRLNFLDNPDQIGSIRKISVVQEKIARRSVRILVKVVDPVGVE